MSVESEALRDLTEKLAGTRPPPPDDRPATAGPGPFQTVRARTRGAIIAAHRDLELDWTEADDRMLDMVTVWLDNRSGRS
jgi:hypothetical protein